MSFDGLTLAVVRFELEKLIIGSRVDRIYQPHKETIVLNLRKERPQSYKLLLSARTDAARVHLISSKTENPFQPPLFCMVLRKHLEGSRLEKIEQPELERFLSFHFSTRDEAGILKKKLLICEIMGKHSNIILTNESGVIIDGIKRYSHETSSYREVLPGCPYKMPPRQEKANPLQIDEDAFRELIISSPLDKKLNEILLESIKGLGPQTCREIVVRAGLKPTAVLDECGEFEINKLWQAFQTVIKMITKKTYKPTLIHGSSNEYISFAPFDPEQYAECPKSYYNTMNKALEAFYSTKEYWGSFNELKQQLERILRREVKRCSKKIVQQEKELAEAEDAEKYKIAGEIITANIFRLSPGDKCLTAQNFYDPEGKEITVPLEPHLTPSENAQKFFKKYRKAQTKKRKVTEQLSEAREELRYLESVLAALGHAEKLEELEDIWEELLQQKYITQQKRLKTGKKSQPSYLVCRSSDGFDIYVGKNNKQNDFITLKLAKSDDLWFHAKNIAGAHVIVKRKNQQEIPKQTVLEAAMLAAAYSKGRNSSNVPVDYTKRKYLHKPKGAKPGMVIYDNYKTLFVTPDKEKIKSLVRSKNRNN